jgi:hypothetical protein
VDDNDEFQDKIYDVSPTLEKVASGPNNGEMPSSIGRGFASSVATEVKFELTNDSESIPRRKNKVTKFDEQDDFFDDIERRESLKKPINDNYGGGIDIANIETKPQYKEKFTRKGTGIQKIQDEDDDEIDEADIDTKPKYKGKFTRKGTGIEKSDKYNMYKASDAELDL